MPVPLTPPGGFEPVTSGTARAFGIPVAVPWMTETLASHPSLHGWAGAHPQRTEMTGRGSVYSIPAPAQGPDGSARWVVRHYYRGGFLARHLGDRYLSVGDPRPVLEARATTEARKRGIPTASVVGGAVYPGGLFYRADLVTEEIPGSADLATALFGEEAHPVDAESALTAAGALIRRLEVAGVFHPDLNAKNILVQATEDGVKAHLVDLDRCCPRVDGVPAPAHPMRRRLERSLRKFEARVGRYLPAGAWSALHEGFHRS